MARQLLLVRHAKSSWDDLTLDDRDRPLAPRGVAALPRLCEHLIGSGVRPGLVLCSTARRTQDTLRGIEAALPPGVPVELEEDLYGASSRALLARLHRIDDTVGCTLLVGHNPGLQELALLLAGSGDADLRARVAEKFPTAAAATLSFGGPWAVLRARGATLDALFTPRRG